MSEPAIRVAGLGKRYMIGAPGERRTFRSSLLPWLTGQGPRRALWAIRGLDFELRRGEALGVIGPNGAGKSTLLLMLAGILQPTEGALEVRGRADPFFQLSSGLQRRLTVHENLELCSALLGMSRKEFEDRLPRIVAFSELEPYLKARLGELSSGLAARLPFATAVHSDLDILLVDEMLSVGDREFQAKCRETFLAFKSQGKTLMIASHDHAMIQALCPTTLYLRAGMPVFLGDTTEALRRCAHDSPKDRPPP